jgi:hypothetical protein
LPMSLVFANGTLQTCQRLFVVIQVKLSGWKGFLGERSIAVITGK